ncbi:MAG: outer membrane beta-barrel domain-containing protein [Deltaproteobacteria bacterium]|nr:outer membrane beta-barrel domain-containing protein [Deltaproteobacteria bacterium]
MLSLTLSFALLASFALAAEGEAHPSAAPFPAVAEDDGGGDDDEPGDSVKAEKAAVKVSEKQVIEEKARKKVIKTIQPKTFMKLHRYEVGPSIGLVANDPFLNRYIIGGVFDYHATEIFAIEVQVGYAPILGDGGCDDPDWKPLSCQLLEKNSVSPDISRLTGHGSLGLQFAPIYGKAAVGDKIFAFDIYGTFGLGATNTVDDLVALQAVGVEEAERTENQVHPTTTIGGGARIAFSESLALRTEVKSMTYIEVINSETLEMKNNLIVQANVSFFFPGMK